MQDCNYGFGKKSSDSFHEVLIRVEKLLNKHGFGVYSRIDMADVLGKDEKLTFKRYLILGACRPDFAREAFAADPNIGLLLPCNIIVYESLDGEVSVMVKDPVHMMDLLNVPGAVEAAIKVKCELEELVEEF